MDFVNSKFRCVSQGSNTIYFTCCFYVMWRVFVYLFIIFTGWQCVFSGSIHVLLNYRCRLWEMLFYCVFCHPWKTKGLVIFIAFISVDGDGEKIYWWIYCISSLWLDVWWILFICYIFSDGLFFLFLSGYCVFLMALTINLFFWLLFRTLLFGCYVVQCSNHTQKLLCSQLHTVVLLIKENG